MNGPADAIGGYGGRSAVGHPQPPGGIRLEGLPPAAQVFVDGGSHHLEILNGGFRAEALQAARPAVTPPAPTPVYVIPNCYAGNRPPSGRLPTGCDIGKLRVTNPAGPAGPASNVKPQAREASAR